MPTRRAVMFGLAASSFAARSLAMGALAACVRRARVAPDPAADFHAARRFAPTRFGEIAYVERGAGPAALFLHGFPLNGYQWRGALDRLAAVRRCIAPDFLALGYTRVAPGQDVGPRAQVAMLIGLLDHLAIEAVDVVANDSGGAVAQLLAAGHPERVRSLLLTNCDTEIESPPAALRPVIELAKSGQFVDRWLAPWRHDFPLARSAEGIGGMCYADPTQPTDDALVAYLAPLLTDAQKPLVHAYAVALEPNPLAGIVLPPVPTRIVWGMADTIFSAAGADHLDRTAPASRGVRRLPGAKLFWPEERPDVIAAEAVALWRTA